MRVRSLRLPPSFIVALLGAISATGLCAQSRTVALTIDDLPFITGNDDAMQSKDAAAAASANSQLVHAIARRHVPVTGFVIEQGVEELGKKHGTAILRVWVRSGLDLGNHSYAHPDFDDLTVSQFEDQVVRGERVIAPLMQAAGRKLEFFRFPFNHTGDTREKHDALAAFLEHRGYHLAPCTIETSDWMFNAVYVKMLARGDNASAARLRTDYLAFTAAQIDYFASLNRQVWGYEPPEIMLIHDNQLNADVIDQLLDIFEAKHYRWASLPEAEASPAYQEPEAFITKYGPMWGYRWAKERNVKVDGSLEQDPPKWVTEYGKNGDVSPRRPRSSN